MHLSVVWSWELEIILFTTFLKDENMSPFAKKKSSIRKIPLPRMLWRKLPVHSVTVWKLDILFSFLFLDFVPRTKSRQRNEKCHWHINPQLDWCISFSRHKWNHYLNKVNNILLTHAENRFTLKYSVLLSDVSSLSICKTGLVDKMVKNGRFQGWIARG